MRIPTGFGYVDVALQRKQEGCCQFVCLTLVDTDFYSETFILDQESFISIWMVLNPECICGEADVYSEDGNCNKRLTLSSDGSLAIRAAEEQDFGLCLDDDERGLLFRWLDSLVDKVVSDLL